MILTIEFLTLLPETFCRDHQESKCHQWSMICGAVANTFQSRGMHKCNPTIDQLLIQSFGNLLDVTIIGVEICCNSMTPTGTNNARGENKKETNNAAD